MNDLETRLRQSLSENGNMGGRTIPKGTEARIRARRTGKAIAGIAALAAFVTVVGLTVPRGTENHRPADGGTGTAEDWPGVVVGNPTDAYVGSSTNEQVVGDKHVLLSGAVDGSEFSFVGYQSTETLTLGSTADKGPWPCLEVAGPAIPGAVPESPGPYPPGYLAATGGVGGYCMTPMSIEGQMGWPPFPDGTDLFMRTGAGGGAGVCDTCVGKRWTVVTGFVTSRVARMEVRLADGSAHDVPVESWPNDAGVGAFIFFPPSPHLVGDVLAYDGDGRLLASAPLCGPDDGTHACDVAPTVQIAPPAGAATVGDAASVWFTEPVPDGWSAASQILTPALTDPHEILALATYRLRPGGPNCAQYPVNAIEDLGPTDALIWLAERQHTSGNAPTRPSDFATWMTTGNVDDSPGCLSGPKDFVHRSGSFSDSGREFDLYVAHGAFASPKTLSELWAILNGMRFTSASSP